MGKDTKLPTAQISAFPQNISATPEMQALVTL